MSCLQHRATADALRCTIWVSNEVAVFEFLMNCVWQWDQLVVSIVWFSNCAVDIALRYFRERNYFNFPSTLQDITNGCVRKIAKNKYELRHFCLSVQPLTTWTAWKTWAPTGWIFMISDMWIFLENLLGNYGKSVGKLQVSSNPDKSKCCFTWTPIYIMIRSRPILLRTRNVSDKFVEKTKTHILCSVHISKILTFTN